MRIATTRSKPKDDAPEIGARTEVRPVGPIAPAPKLTQPRRSRRPAMLALMVLTVVLGALGAYLLVDRSSERTQVVGLFRDVDWGQTISATDLIAVDVVPESALKTVTWDDRSALIGKKAAVGLRAGSLITPDAVTTETLPERGGAIVGLLLKEGQLPVAGVQPQDHVVVVITDTAGVAQGAVQSPPSDTASAESPGIDATVSMVGPVDQMGSRTVDVIVPTSSVAQVATAAAGGRVVIVLVSQN